MSSKRRIRRKQCKGKVRHVDMGAAYAALRSHRRRHGEGWPMSVYPCQFCGGWHIGHTPKRHA